MNKFVFFFSFKDKENLQQKYDDTIKEIRGGHEKHIEELISINDKKRSVLFYFKVLICKNGSHQMLESLSNG